MGRPLTKLVLFFVAMNAGAAMMQGMGVADAIGLDASVSQQCPDNPTQEQIETNPNCELIEETENVETGTGQGSTLFGMYNTLSRGLSNIYDYVFPGLAMLERAGMPGEMKDYLGTIFSVMIAIAALSYTRGWDL